MIVFFDDSGGVVVVVGCGCGGLGSCWAMCAHDFVSSLQRFTFYMSRGPGRTFLIMMCCWLWCCWLWCWYFVIVVVVDGCVVGGCGCCGFGGGVGSCVLLRL